MIKFYEDVFVYEWVIINNDYENGNCNIFVEGMILDWNLDC